LAVADIYPRCCSMSTLEDKATVLLFASRAHSTKGRGSSGERAIKGWWKTMTLCSVYERNAFIRLSAVVLACRAGCGYIPS
jgi:hypothetical protein